VQAPLLVSFLILASFALAGCGGSRDACADIKGTGDILSCWKQREHLPNAALAGEKEFIVSGCTACHSYLGVGGSADLSAVGRIHGIRYFERFVADPKRYGIESMPRFAALGQKTLHQLAVFLAASKGER
jgi:cbb3-type cytochrome oxidase cytochrome c subunit